MVDYLIFPFVILLLSVVFFTYQPKKINYFLGYRTKNSLKNQKAWNYANKLASRLFLVLSVFMTLICFGFYKYKIDHYFILLPISIEIIIIYVVIENRLNKLFHDKEE